MKIKIKNKKAIVLPETLKIIIGVLCIIILIYLAYQLYNLFLTKTDLEQARETLQQLTEKLEKLEEGKEDSYLVLAPNKNWHIIAYDEGKDSPALCNGKNCLCICNGLKIEDCNKEGVCEIIKDKIKVDQYENFIFWCSYSATPVREISLMNAPLNIFLRRKSSYVLLSESEVSEPMLLKPLFSEEIEFKGEKISFDKFLLENYASNCDKEKFQYVLKDVKNPIKEISNNYVDSLIKDSKVEWGRVAIKYCLIKDDQVEEGAKYQYPEYSGSQNDDKKTIEEKIICDNDNIIAIVRLYY